MPPPQPRNQLLSTGRESAWAGGGVKEVIDYSFYDRYAVVTAAAANNVFFQTAGVNPLVSNFEGAGQMPAGQAFHVRTLRLVIEPQSPVLDVINLMKNISLIFTVENSKKYASGPAWMYPAGVGVTSETVTGNAAPAAPATGLSRGNNGIPSLGNTYQFRRPISLRPQQPFQISIAVNAAIVLTATTNIYVVIDGDLERNII